MGCGHSKNDDTVHRVTSPHVDVVHRITSAHVKKAFNTRKNSAKSTSSSSSSSSDDSKHGSKKEKKKKAKKNKVVSPVIKANEDDILNIESQKPLTPIPKSAGSRGSITRKSSSSGFSEHEKDASSIDPNDVERKADDEETGPAIFSIGSNDEEDKNIAQEDTGLTNENTTDKTDDGGEENQNANDLELSQPEIIADDEEDAEDNEDNTDGISGNNENDNDIQQSNEQHADDEDLGIYEDNGNTNDIDDENDKTHFDDSEQQMNGEGEDVPDTYREDNDGDNTEQNKSREPSHDDVAIESNDNYDISDGGYRIPTPRCGDDEEAVEDGLDVPDTFRMELHIGISGMDIISS